MFGTATFPRQCRPEAAEWVGVGCSDHLKLSRVLHLAVLRNDPAQNLPLLGVNALSIAQRKISTPL
jgi:hypothetical protein